MKHKDGKYHSQPDKGFKIVPATLLVIVLCGFSFYLGGIFCSEKNKLEGKTVQDVSKAVSSSKEPAVRPLQIKSVAFPECSIDYQDYTPCTDPRVTIDHPFNDVTDCLSWNAILMNYVYCYRNGGSMVFIGLLS